jgi:4-diphosphocytidyl-2-C-methyl-D-erythritol kinase
MTDRTVTARAHAKINVFLRVLERLDDGFHAIESLIVPLELHDLVSATSAATLTLHVAGERAVEIPADHDNLALSAARALAEAAGMATAAACAAIEIDKRIPVAAGMGGGSADAAATLRVLNELWGTGLDDRALAEVAVSIGSDVPAMLAGEPVFARGRGEHVVPVHMPSTWWVIRPFSFGVRTPDAYAWWDREGSTGHDPGVLIAAAEAGNVEMLGLSLFNDLQGPVCIRHREVTETIAAFEDAGALGAVMTGSGPTVAALARHLGHADRLAEAVPGAFVTGGPPPATDSVPQAG